MPNIKSAKKRLKQSLKRRDRNRTTKAAMRTSVKKAEKGVEAGAADAAAAVKAACISLDKTAQKGVIHKNTASRKKSRLMKKLNTTAKTAKA